jgi:FlaA1/EpsC-like NDP-sugar epimerase
MIFKNQIPTPRWLIFVIDLSVVVFSVLLAYLLRFNFRIPESELKPLPQILLFIVIVRALSFVIARSYAGIIRYTTTADTFRVVMTIFGGSLFFGLTNIVTYYFINSTFFIPYSIIIIDLLITSLFMITFRLVVKTAYFEFNHPLREKVNVIIFGAGETGITTKSVLERDEGTNYKVLAFLDDNPQKAGKKLEGIDIYSPEKLEGLIETNKVANVILSSQDFDADRKQSIVDLCLAKDVKVMFVPPAINWINGELSFKQIKKINIEDLLEREEIRLDAHRISSDLAGKTILITGAAGSIGSEIARQVARFFPGKLVLVDQSETALHYLELEFSEHHKGTDVVFLIADICNLPRMDFIFRKFNPDIVYHAAAYKHVPVMENNPSEAILTNVGGTKVIADLSVQYSVKKFIMISTDKAVNPTSVMGASKRIAEIYAQSMNKKNITRFVTTRFGNVLGSNGSVIPLFHSQIEKGGPVTITHPDITRYFMTIPESCQLVLEAGSMGNGGEIYIFDMGKSVKIVDLAKKMIRLSGLELGKDIQIKFIGLRPGEKLYEELLNKEENTLPTHHPQILIARVREYEPENVFHSIWELIMAAGSGTNQEIVWKMKRIIPEFISQNSVYEPLDQDGGSPASQNN